MAVDGFPRILTPPKGSFFVFGARGTGKSTWLRRHFDVLEAYVQTCLREEIQAEALVRNLPASRAFFPSRRSSTARF